ncbi:unnamed protein product [Boreogadus saida]
MNGLSLLSRGCGHVEEQHGRLEVCFTPQDYYIWRSQQSLLRLTNNSSGLLQGGAAIAAKTYSTRRGPLLIYTQDQVSRSIAHQSAASLWRNGQGSRPEEQFQKPITTQRSSLVAMLNCGSKKVGIKPLNFKF